MKSVHRSLQSPIGPLLLVGNADGLQRIDFPRNGEPAPPDLGSRPDTEGVLGEAARQLEEYFAGRRHTFELKLNPRGTDFQKSVWRALLEIPFGGTTSYGELAKKLGRPTASRAVGAANGSNPIPIIVPCHRVIGKNGQLTGYAGGLPIKKQLLEHEANASVGG
ncbi:MAG: methylated-DNA--[protein]-cysteine S-methyltransferase [Planctomycetota bacterium]